MSQRAKERYAKIAAVTSMVLGAASIVLSLALTPAVSLVCGIIGIILALWARREHVYRATVTIGMCLAIFNIVLGLWGRAAGILSWLITSQG